MSKNKKVWAHLHLPRLKAFESGQGTSEVISVKTPGHRISYVSSFSMKDCTFFVSAKGRERTLRSGQRNVHAWVIGEPKYIAPATMKSWKKAIYDPWKGPDFVDSVTLQPVYSAAWVYMIGKVVYYREY
jgi:hypothetical protein